MFRPCSRHRNDHTFRKQRFEDQQQFFGRQGGNIMKTGYTGQILDWSYPVQIRTSGCFRELDNISCGIKKKWGIVFDWVTDHQLLKNDSVIPIRRRFRSELQVSIYFSSCVSHWTKCLFLSINGILPSHRADIMIGHNGGTHTSVNGKGRYHI
jgi:hypothetical protein